MKTIYLVTGNAEKLREWQRMFPADIELKAVDVDIAEIQSSDLEEIIVDKAKKAFAHVKKPVFVDDISAGLDELNGLPGPFIKYFEEILGKGALHKLAHQEQSPAVLTATMAYYDGVTLLTASGVLRGHVVAPRGNDGWGFDFCFVPEGHDQTFAEMGPKQKDVISHRSKAIKNLLAKLAQST